MTQPHCYQLLHENSSLFPHTTHLYEIVIQKAIQFFIKSFFQQGFKELLLPWNLEEFVIKEIFKYVMCSYTICQNRNCHSFSFFPHYKLNYMLDLFPYFFYQNHSQGDILRQTSCRNLQSDQLKHFLKLLKLNQHSSFQWDSVCQKTQSIIFHLSHFHERIIRMFLLLISWSNPCQEVHHSADGDYDQREYHRLN